MNLLIVPVLLTVISVLSSLQASEPTVIKGSSTGKYAKPGAPVDIRYTTQNVEAGESSEVNITLITSVTFGSMHVNIRTDKDLTFIKPVESNMTFKLDENNSVYPLQLFMTAQKDGVYYIKLLVHIDKQGSRAFAVPVYIGEGRVKKAKTSVQKTASGENISVSKAVESRE